MKPECIQAINKSAGKVLSDSELNRIEEDIIRHVRNIPSEGLSRAERYRMAGERAQESRIKETAKLIHDHIDEAYKRQNILDDINNVEAGIHGKTRALFQKLFHQAGSSEVSLEKKIDAHYNSTIAPLEEYLTGGIFTMDKQYNKDVISELLGEKTGNSKASALARTYEKINKDKHREALEAGSSYKYRENRVPQPMDATKLNTITESDFVKTMLELVDRDKYKNTDGTLYSDEKLSSLFSHSFKEVLGGKEGHINFGSKVGKKRTYERHFHFKDADAHLEFMEKFGTSANVGELLATDIRSLSKDIVIARELGVNADDFVRKTIKELIAEDTLASAGKDTSIMAKLGISPLKTLEHQFTNMWDVMIHGSRPENVFWANFGAGIRSYTHSVKLGSHSISSFLEDGRMSHDMLSRIGIDKAEISRIKKLPLAERKEMLSDLGLFADGDIAHGRLISEGLYDAYKVGHKLASGVHKLSGVKWNDEHVISKHAMIVYNQIGRMTEKYVSLKDLMADKGLDDGVKLFFKQLDDTDFQVLRRTEATTGIHGDLSIKSPNNIRNISDNVLMDLVAKLSEEKTKHIDLKLAELKMERSIKEQLKTQLTEIRSREASLLKDKVANKINALVLSNLQTSIRGSMGSSLLDRQRLGLLDLKAGTIKGELWRMLIQFSPTPTSMAFTNLVDLPASENMPKGTSMKLNLGKINDVRFKYATNMILAGMVASSVKALIRGEDPSFSGVVNDGLLSNGALVPYYNIIASLASKEQGAVSGTLRSIYNAGHKVATGADNTAAHVIKAFREITPFTRLWYVKNSVDHIIINQLIEHFNPGYLAKKQRKLEKKGVEFFQDLDELTPFNRMAEKGLNPI